MPTSAILTCVYPPQRPRPNPLPVRPLPPTIHSLFQPEYKDLTKDDLQAKCQEIFATGLVITEDEAAYLAEATKLQAKSLLWFDHRRGRITASKFHPVCRTSITSPSQSLVQQILKTGGSVTSAAIEWGVQNEKVAVQEFKKKVSPSHTSFELKFTGLHVNAKYPHLGASPDGLVSCECCGEGLLEVKCPYSIRHTSPTSADTPKDFYLKPDNEGTLKLSRTHKYYYQVQGQMAVCERKYTYFVCWTPQGLHLERIEQDQQFFSSIKPTLDYFFLNVILPGVLRGECTENQCQSPSSKKQKPLYCYCQREEKYDDMIECENPSCTYGWYHFSCVNIVTPPTGQWYCDDCKNAV